MSGPNAQADGAGPARGSELKVSVVITAHNAAWCLPRCLESLADQERPADEIVLVDDGSTDETAAIAEAAGARIVHHQRALGVGAARVSGIEAARGDAIVLRDADDWFDRGHIARLAERFEAGDELLAAAIVPEPTGRLSGFVREHAYEHDFEARNGFLPVARGAGLAFRRHVHDRVGGFDPLLVHAEDADFCYRCGLAGYRLTPVPEARVHYRLRGSHRSLLRHRIERGYWSAFLAWKYQRFPFVLVRPRPRVGREIAKAGALVALGRPREARRALLQTAAKASVHLGRWRGTLDILLLRRRPPAILRPPFPTAGMIARPLPDGPAALLTGEPPLVGQLARALMADRSLVSPPLGLVGSAAANWAEPPPWSRRLARDARRAGWPIVVDPAARRIEVERPATWGEAYLALHGAFATQHAKGAYVVGAPGAAGDAIAARLPRTPVVHLGRSTPPRAAAVELPDLRDRELVVRRISEALGIPLTSGVAGALRLARLTSLVRRS